MSNIFDPVVEETDIRRESSVLSSIIFRIYAKEHIKPYLGKKIIEVLKFWINTDNKIVFNGKSTGERPNRSW